MTGTDGTDAVDQLVVRWQGGRRGEGKGLTVAASSAPAEWSDWLLQELAPLLRVEGGEPRPSLVRTITSQGEVALVQRWPTVDHNGRPNTASHVLVGSLRSLPVQRCLLLRDWSWSTKAFAEEQSGPLHRVDRGELGEVAGSGSPTFAATAAAVPAVAQALAAATAELLRAPQQRLSLLSGALPAGPEAHPAALLLFGLHGIFGARWLRRHWTFATYDTVDTHPLLLTAVAEWLRPSSPDEQLSRVDPARPVRDRAQELADQLVQRYLADPHHSAGLPELLGDFRDGAGLPRFERLEQLSRLLDAPRRRPQEPEPDSVYQGYPPPQWPPSWAVPTRSEELTDRQLLNQLRDSGDNWEAARLPLRRFHTRAELSPELRSEVCAQVLAQKLYLYSSAPDHAVPDHALPDHAAPDQSVPDQSVPDQELDERLVERAAQLFQWAVAPEVRNPVHREALGGLLRLLALSSTPLDRKLLRLAVLATPDGVPAPDLPPDLWQQLFQDLARPATPARPEPHRPEPHRPDPNWPEPQRPAVPAPEATPSPAPALEPTVSYPAPPTHTPRSPAGQEQRPPAQPPPQPQPHPQLPPRNHTPAVVIVTGLTLFVLLVLLLLAL
ncbi:hypothetical protein [Kitasatospora azatica]|uniref:hypothetical protein n=1 Tax=Kitasatospora azatica TaxID=58347 RepID=UPI000566A8B4|nr:hypothetical protein [Kitasatospora azatica]